MSPQKSMSSGLDALIAESDVPGLPDRRSCGVYVDMPIAALTPGRLQPRHAIDDEALAELVQSIQQQGILQPILVREVPGSAAGTGVTPCEIVAGERRWRAARLAGLDSVPVVVRELDDQAALAVTLIENLQREDLNAIEVAESLFRLIEEFGLTHREAADAVGRSRSSVSNFLRLLDLGDEARDALAAGRLEMGHARALLPLHEHDQRRVARQIPAQGLSVRDVERLVARLLSEPAASSARPGSNLQTKWLQQQFARELGVKVGIRTRKDGSNTIGIDFDDLEQLQETLRKIEKLVGQVVDTAGRRYRDWPEPQPSQGVD